MRFLGKPSPPPEPPPGRRRPVAANDGGQRPSAFSYYAQRASAPERAGRQPLEEMTIPHQAGLPLWLRNRTVAYVVGVALLAGFIYSTALGTDPKIQPVTSNGSAYFMQSPQVYQQAAAKSLSGSILNRNKLTVNTAKVSSDLTDNYPELETAAVIIPLIGQQPVIKVSPYKPSVMLTTPEGGVYLLDTTGRALVSASQITSSGELSVPTVQAPGISGIRLGAQTLSTRTVQFIQQVTAILDAAHISTGTLKLPAGTSELDIPVSGKPYFVKFNLQDDPRQQAGTFLATKERLDHDNATPSQYIDVRVLGRAYYK